MIGKQVKGKGFRGLLNYLEGKEQAQLIGGNMSGRNARELSAEFGLSRALNPNAKRHVYHASLSLPPHERLTNQQWGEVAASYLEQMGYVNNQYAVYRHYDQEHDHIHIIASRIRLDTAKVVHDGWDYKRSEVVIRKLEREYGLQEVVSSSERIERTASTGQKRRVEREEEDYRQGKREAPPELPVKQKLQQLISVAAADQPTMPVFFERLQHLGVEVKHGYTRTGKSKGISYCYQEQAFSGTNLGAAYTFPGLQKHLGIDYQSERDDCQLKRDDCQLKLDERQRKRMKENSLLVIDLPKAEDSTEQTSSVVPRINVEQNQAQNLYIQYSKPFEHLTPNERDNKVIVQALRDNVPKALIQDILSASSIEYSPDEREELLDAVYEQLAKQQELLLSKVQRQPKPKSIDQDFELD